MVSYVNGHVIFQRAAVLNVDGETWTEKAIRKGCSKRAFGSLVVALQSSGNEGILEETFEWLIEKASKGTESHTLPTNSQTSQAVTTNNVVRKELKNNLISPMLIKSLTFCCIVPDSKENIRVY